MRNDNNWCITTCQSCAFIPLNFLVVTYLTMTSQYSVGTWMTTNLHMNIGRSASFNTYGVTGFITLVLPRPLVVFTKHSSLRTPATFRSHLDAMVSFSLSIVLTTFLHTFFSTYIASVQWRTRKYYHNSFRESMSIACNTFTTSLHV